MAVAKTYENMTQIGEPFEHDGKMYIRVRGACPRCGGSGHYSYNQMDGTRCYGCNGSGKKTMEVRWYTDAQRATMDRAAEKRAAAAKIKKEERRVKSAPRNAMGFGEKGYITLYKGDNKVISEFFKNRTIDEEGHKAAWYNNIFHWYTPSKLPVPEDLPQDIQPIILKWEEIADPEDKENLLMKPEEEVIKYVKSLIEEPSHSEYQGEIGKWITRALTIDKNIFFDNRYGTSCMHVMHDSDGNVFVWTSNSKMYEENSNINLKMKIKDHKEYNGVKQTIVYYCKVM